MNILFLLKDLNVGGVEIVTAVLANKFSEEGHDVTIWAFQRIDNDIASRIDEDATIVYGCGLRYSKENEKKLRDCIVNNRIEIVIDQWALPFFVTRTLCKAVKGLQVKVIAVYHNNPESNGRLKGVEMELDNTSNPFKSLLLNLKYKAFKFVTSRSLKHTYNICDNFIVLSNSFVDGFKRFTHITDASKLRVLTNPVTIGTKDYVYDLNAKEKEIIFCGRLDENQKRVSRIIDVWGLLEEKNPDWRLTFVGDGEERNNLEAACKRMELKRVSFEGFTSPIPYYKRASLLILTSEYEGFPLVLAECMSFGVVPVVYGSYPAVYDIIEDGKNGMICYKSIDSFPHEEMSEIIQKVIADKDLRKRLSQEAIETSKSYDIKEIYGQWIRLFNLLYDLKK